MALSKSDRLYFTRLILASVFCTISVIIASVFFLLDSYKKNTGSTIKTLRDWSKNSDCASEVLEDIFRVQQQKENYRRLGIGAEDAKINKTIGGGKWEK